MSRTAGAGSVVNVLDHRGQFFRILQTTPRSQTGVMTIGPGGDSGPEETHDADQVIYVIEGEGVVRLGREEHAAARGACVVIPSGTVHHVRNPGPTPLFCLTVYAPPEY
jgi:mannose-6-phosphate isomerase-like protein (cupin superfamily)